ncbi:stalk domain-containing protein [Paenibacillus pini]|uniref:Copper amine oxidase-like N-terminal domain-containing protein n=1 Tax=Paenibacillus pini JCM 16418 TaxID=1236976 RepID=W7YU29_9BACL|nr:stalk domain-containing protein [Paenibacillus pini]GAF10713.1 hypothetical protein JCM16418_4932 [Paenibacillus pini JCM 16418]
MKDKIKGLVLGITIGTMLTGTAAFAANGTSIKAVIQKMNIYVDGSKKINTDAISYKGTTYVPVRAIGNSIGKQVGLQGDNLYIGKQPTVKVTQDRAIDLVYKKIKKDADKYKLRFMIDGEENNKYTVWAYEQMSDHTATYGWYYVNKNTGKVTKMDIASGEEVDA